MEAAVERTEVTGKVENLKYKKKSIETE